MTKVQRKLITIESDRSGAYRPFEDGLLILDYGRVLKNCSLKCAYPKPNKKYRDIFLWSSVGVAAFTHRGVDLIVAWGADTEPWCSVHLYADIVCLEVLSSEENFSPPGASACSPQELVEYLERADLSDESLTRVFKKSPLLWSQPFKHSRAGVALTISGSWIDCEFVGRKFRRLRLFARVEPTCQASGESKSWFRKTANKQEDDPKYPLRVKWGESDDCV
jgi:hypothetical protein